MICPVSMDPVTTSNAARAEQIVAGCDFTAIISQLGLLGRVQLFMDMSVALGHSCIGVQCAASCPR